MELRKYIFPLRRWFWLPVTAMIVAAISTLIYTLQLPPTYQARTTLIIGRTIEDPNPSSVEFSLSQQLAYAYADMANRELVRDATLKALNLRRLPVYQARALPNNQLIEIVVVDIDPLRAQVVANELANQLILLSPTASQPDEQNRIEFVNQQLDTLEVQIEETEAEIKRLQEELGNMVSARQITDTQNQISALRAKHTTLQANYAALLSNTQGGAVNTLTIIEPAALPTRPVGPNRLLSVAIAASIGFVVAAAAAYLLEYLDDTIRQPEDVEKLVNVPIIGYIGEFEKGEESKLYVAENPRHPVVEAFRTLRTNLEFVGVDQPLKTILVSSAETGDGKSSVAANLAVVMAQGERKVILVDADLRRPRVHHYLGLPNEYGLSEIFRGRINIDKAIKWKDEQISVVTAGNLPPNPSELLGSKKMEQILTRLKEVADVVIIDGPPFVVADASVLSSKVDGVLLVVRPGFTHKPAIQAMMEQLRLANARVVGVVMNRIPLKGADYFGGQRYISPYYPRDGFMDDTRGRKHGGGSGQGNKWVEKISTAFRKG